MNAVIGVDLGSRTTKIVQLVDGDIHHSELFETGHDPLPRVKKILERLSGSRIVATGYGRHLVTSNLKAERVTEIKACAKGAHFLFPSCRTIVDLGGQDSKVILVDKKSAVIDFEMNDRCAAGTGKFLEFMAQTFGMDIEEFIQTAKNASNHVAINSMCTVFAESEVVSLVTSGRPKEEIALGLHMSIAARLQAMLAKASLEGDILFVGGGAKNDCLHSLLEDKLKRTIKRPDEPQTVSALGAALLAMI
ncbi:MAG: acyl-CoA dehydratase activase [Candidatus Aminicenantes bacterium]|jgi:predicted CoA-substrate-specific enzyme activase